MSDSANDSRACPWCAETIKTAAITCRYCGSDVSSHEDHSSQNAGEQIPVPATPAPTEVETTCSNGHSNLGAIRYCRLCGVSIASFTPTDELPVGDVVSQGTKFDGRTNQDRTGISEDGTQSTIAVSQTSVTNRSTIGIILSLLFGAIGGIFGVVLGRHSLRDIDMSEGRLQGRGSALTSVVFGWLAIAGTLVLVVALVATNSKGNAPNTSSNTTASDYTIQFTDEIFGTSCADMNTNVPAFNSSSPVRVFGPNGQQIASGVYDSGYGTTDQGKSGTTVKVCIFTATIRGIPKSFSNYVFTDSGDSAANGVAITRSNVAADVAGMTRGYAAY